MGIAADSRDNMWIANSGLVDLPCPGPVDIDLSGKGGSLSMVGKGGGLTISWGISVDGDDNVWVSNFAEQRISQFCGVKTWKCPPGSETGDPISPNGDGYFFDGFVRLTAVQVDQSGTVWVANNWKLLPVQTNPGGYEVIVMVGAAAPVERPVIGPTKRLR